MFRKKSLEDRIDHFWKWFEAHGSLTQEPPSEPVRGLLKQLSKVTKGLVWACSAESKDITRLLEISPDGVRSLANTARLVVQRAPEITGWRFVAFRQPVKGAYLNMFGLSYSDETFQVVVYRQGDVEWLRLFYPDELDAKRMISVAPILIDCAIGEEDVLEFELLHPKPLSEAPPEAMPLSAFAKLFLRET